MFIKSALLAAALTALTATTQAQPACFDTAISEQPNNGGGNICGQYYGAVQNAINTLCQGADLPNAQAALAQTCQGQNGQNGQIINGQTLLPGQPGYVSYTSPYITTFGPYQTPGVPYNINSPGFVLSVTTYTTTSTFFDAGCSCTRTSSYFYTTTPIPGSPATPGVPYTTPTPGIPLPTTATTPTTSFAYTTPTTATSPATFTGGAQKVLGGSLAGAAAVVAAGFAAAL
ncbi:MAG: hypothetical protein M1838_005374 [Thelocarpon superellum]|nr:MAG: hypothetical protein M1838_005374 [Thelocarpon superellum]